MLLQTSSDMIFVKDANLVYRGASLSFAKVVGKASAEEIIVAKFVYNPYGAIVELTNGNSVKVAHEGRYEIRIIVIDKIGNVKMIQTYVTVTK